MNINSQFKSAGIQIDRNFGAAVRELDSPNTNMTPDGAHRLAAEHFERVRTMRDVATSANGPEAAAANAAQESFHDQFSKLAGDKEKFHSLMKEVYGDNYNVEAAEGFRQRALKGDYSWLPKIEFKSNAELTGGNGAYDASKNVVYINKKYMNDPARAAKVYSEEVGAFLDTKLNKTDTVGDEGEMFRKLLSGAKLTDAEKAAIRADNDHGVITVNGKKTEVEFSFLDDIGGAIKDAASAVGGAIKKGAGKVWDGIKSAASHTWDGLKWAGGRIGSQFKRIGLKIWDGIKSGADKVWEGYLKPLGGLIEKGWNYLTIPYREKE